MNYKLAKQTPMEMISDLMLVALSMLLGVILGTTASTNWQSTSQTSPALIRVVDGNYQPYAAKLEV